MTNPLLDDFKNSSGIPPFEDIKTIHYKPAFLKAIKDHKNEIDSIIFNNDAPNFFNTINSLENAGSLLSKVSRVFFNLLSAN